MTDTTLTALSPEGIEYTLHPAGPAARGCAFAIDGAAQAALFLVIEIIASITRGATAYWLSLLLIFLIDWFYHVFFELVFCGQSLGKRLIGLRVAGIQGEPVRPAASVLRNLLRFADGFFMLYHIAIASICLGRGFKRLGDFAGGTLVIYTHAARFSIPSFSSGGLSGASLNALDACGISMPKLKLSVDEKQALAMLENRYPLLGAARAREILKPWVDSV